MAFFYENDELCVGSKDAFIKLKEIFKQSNPVYVYDLDSVQHRVNLLKQSLSGLKTSIHYAVKANANPSLLRMMSEMGLGADVVSAGEIAQATAAGIVPEKIIFSGVGKTIGEIETALKIGVKQINVESPQELERIAALAAKQKVQARVAFRMNPDVNPETHPYITTGFRENKFGMDESFLPELRDILAKNANALKLCGLTLHIGSQLLSLNAIREAVRKTKSIYLDFIKEGHALSGFDVGGGLGIHYETDEEQSEEKMVQLYGQMLREELSDLKCEILLEPGRILVGRAGILLSEVQYLKRAPSKNFAILNTGMHHLLRPALYQARHRILPLLAKRSQKLEFFDFVGPICESSDVIRRDCPAHGLKQGDAIGILDVGAYGRSMSSFYNAHPFPREVLVKDGAFSFESLP